MAQHTSSVYEMKWLQEMQCDDNNNPWSRLFNAGNRDRGKVKWLLQMHRKSKCNKYDEGKALQPDKCHQFWHGIYILCSKDQFSCTVRSRKKNRLFAFDFLSFPISYSVRYIMFAVMHLSHRFVMLIDKIVASLRRIQTQSNELHQLWYNGRSKKRTIQFNTC